MSAPTHYRCTEDAELVDHLLRWGELRGLSAGKIKYLADLMERNIALPAIRIVWGLGMMWSIQDGHHRCAASLSLGHTETLQLRIAAPGA
jgi:hypothetical protein